MERRFTRQCRYSIQYCVLQGERLKPVVFKIHRTPLVTPNRAYQKLSISCIRYGDTTTCNIITLVSTRQGAPTCRARTANFVVLAALLMLRSLRLFAAYQYTIFCIVIIMVYSRAIHTAVRAKAAGFYINTPLLSAATSAARWGGLNVRFKMENLQPSGSFKDRGIGNMIQSLRDSTNMTRLICSSGGNAGLSVATIGEKIGLPVDVFVPITTLPMMIDKLKQRNANVFVGGENWNAADVFARSALANDPFARYIPPYDDPLIWEGHSTIVDELKASFGDSDKPDMIILSVGGGGLLAGIQRGLDQVGWSDVRVVAVETEGAASFAAAHAAGKIIKLEKISTVASSLGALSVTPVVLDPNSRAAQLTESMVVTDIEAVSACLQFADEQRFLIEPACGAGLSAIYSARCRDILIADSRKGANVVVIVCGGSVVSLDLLQMWREKFILTPTL